VRFLLDTHVVLWAASDPGELRSEARALLESGANDVRVSLVTAWEIAIKQSLGKLDLAKPAERWLPEVLRRTGFDVAELDLASALRVRALPWHHRDPFDRLLIAQAIECGYTVMTRDTVFAAYGVPVVEA
jgi:PIN domain nuclease of toxin-antitoxin system